MTSTFSPERRSMLRRAAPLLVVYGLLAALMIYGTASSERFLTEQNILNILRNAAFLGTLAIGQTLVILSGGIDLSVGSVAKLSVLVTAILMDGKPENMFVAIVATLAIGALIGAIHATAVTQLNIAPFIVTLGTYSILRGIALTVATSPVGRAAPELVRFYDLKIGPVYALTLIFLALLLIVIFMLKRTPFGRYIYAVGGGEQVARLSGVPVKRVKYGVYILCSMFAAFTGVLMLSRYGVGDPVVGDGLELQAITAVILGGTSLFGGRGSLLGTLGGVLLLGLTSNLLVVLNLDQWLRELVQGLIIVTAVALYKQRGRQ
ncbi:MAG: ABC transporter permease [Burkholderiales bacterium]|nr:ABC transporter permease [Anaerolineae bacterium]